MQNIFISNILRNFCQGKFYSQFAEEPVTIFLLIKGMEEILFHKEK